MARRMKAETRMKRAVDAKDTYQFAWALLDIARLEWQQGKAFETLSVTDIKNLLQAIMTAAPTSKEDKEQHTATIHDIKQYLK